MFGDQPNCLVSCDVIFQNIHIVPKELYSRKTLCTVSSLDKALSTIFGYDGRLQQNCLPDGGFHIQNKISKHEYETLSKS